VYRSGVFSRGTIRRSVVCDVSGRLWLYLMMADVQEFTKEDASQTNWERGDASLSRLGSIQHFDHNLE
jgi:hypothetical protein